MKQYVFDALQQRHQTARWHNLEDHKADRNYPKHTVWPVATDDSLHRRPVATVDSPHRRPVATVDSPHRRTVATDDSPHRRPVATDDSLHRRPAKSETAIKYRVRKKLSEFWKAKAYKLSERCNVS